MWFGGGQYDASSAPGPTPNTYFGGGGGPGPGAGNYGWSPAAAASGAFSGYNANLGAINANTFAAKPPPQPQSVAQNTPPLSTARPATTANNANQNMYPPGFSPAGWYFGNATFGGPHTGSYGGRVT